MYTEPLSIRMSESVTSYYHPGQMYWNYDQGFVVMSVLDTGLLYGRKELVTWACDMYDAVINEDGTIKGYREQEYNLDRIQSGRILFDIYEATGKKKYLKAIEHLNCQLESQPRTHAGVFWHKEIYPWQVWLDGLYMQGPFWTRCSHSHDVMQQLMETYKILRDEKTGLLYHAWDESRGMRWSDEKTGLSPNFWSRSIGWYLMACIDVLEYAPKEEPLSENIRTITGNLMEAVFRFQDRSGMWYQVTDLGGREGNYLEVSGTSMFCYSALKASRMGFLKGFEDKAVKGLEAVERLYLSTDAQSICHLNGICGGAGLGGNPYRDGSFEYYTNEKRIEDDCKGTGAFIIALLEKERYQKTAAV